MRCVDSFKINVYFGSSKEAIQVNKPMTKVTGLQKSVID